MNRIYKTEKLNKECWSNLSDKERGQLLDLIIDNSFTSYLEIGVMRGGNLINMTNLLKLNNKECEIVGYDCFELLRGFSGGRTNIGPDKKVVEANVNEIHDCQVELVQGLSKDIVSTLKGRTFDLIFHDADHTRQGVYDDLIILKKILRPNGYVCVHDARQCKAHECYEAIEDICGEGHYEKIGMHGTIATLKPTW